ncbi:PE family protein [Mycobacterium paragordonae]|uniref:PE domain-containing protein n=1 Tax=Mycobacterium paragordonae TaxID=1389713 RepID=A0ABQ1BXM5_9MYCO|nr:PE family protein [Mycobacterium paragordonae]TDK94054.1 PE family protein [Mycobacterium paragordonae]GFG76876.1 hypothetical protein MPRG_01520 [Mycobacterium paragordonae]
MSAVIAAPDVMKTAAIDLSAIGSSLRSAHIVAGPPTVTVVPAAADEISASIADLFSGYARDYQKLAGEAAASYEDFVRRLTASAGAYASAEAANVASLLQPLTAIAAPVAAAATGLQELVDLGTSLVSNAVILIGGGLFLLAASVFVSWLVADIALLLLGGVAVSAIVSLPFYPLVLSLLDSVAQSLIAVTYPIFAAFPIFGTLFAAIGGGFIGAGIVFFLPLILAFLFLINATGLG